MRKNGDSVLLLDLEDERGASIRVICLGPVRERYECVLMQACGRVDHRASACNIHAFIQ